MKLAFYGGGDQEDNQLMDESLLKLTTNKSTSEISITFIPSSCYDADVYFQNFIKRFGEFGISKFLELPVDIHVDNVMMNEAFNSDIIYLSGGNTYYFLKYLRANKYLQKLKTFVKNGGILAGLSAGAILMTHNISMAGVPSFDCDDNDEGVTNLKSLNLVNFEFFPHFRKSKRYHDFFMDYSRDNERPIYASNDGSGVIVEKEVTTFVKGQTIFFQGKKHFVK